MTVQFFHWSADMFENPFNPDATFIGMWPTSGGTFTELTLVWIISRGLST